MTYDQWKLQTPPEYSEPTREPEPDLTYDTSEHDFVVAREFSHLAEIARLDGVVHDLRSALRTAIRLGKAGDVAELDKLAVAFEVTEEPQ